MNAGNRFTLAALGGLLADVSPLPFFRQFGFCILFCLSAQMAIATWTPPANPDPRKIYNEASDDVRAGRHEDALAKLVWYHQNALKYDQALRGVRLSFALGEWKKLGKVYPPAAAKFREIRDEAAQNVRDGKEHPQAFIDFEAICQELREDSKIKELFVWLDVNAPERARVVYPFAERELIAEKEYHLCGKYIDPVTSYAPLVSNFRTSLDSKGDNILLRHYHREYQKAYFTREVSTLVALLVLNDRKSDADGVAAKALKEWSNRDFKKSLEKAKLGELP